MKSGWESERKISLVSFHLCRQSVVVNKSRYPRINYTCASLCTVGEDIVNSTVSYLSFYISGADSGDSSCIEQANKLTVGQQAVECEKVFPSWKLLTSVNCPFEY